jgi:chromosome segregation ATPase
MSLPRISLLIFAVLVVTFTYPASTTFAQTNKASDPAQNPDKTMQQLLTEVRELRLAVQRATTSHTRFQVLIERVRIQQNHQETVSRQLENLRSQFADLKAAKPQMEQQIKEAEELLERTTDPNRRTDLESQIKSMKANFARFGPEEERVRNRELALETDLQNSQQKLNELNSQLDALMNELKGP